MRGFIFLIICLLFWLIYQDLSKSPLLSGQASEPLSSAATVTSAGSYTAVRMQIEAGDTILSLTEKLNGSKPINIDQLRKDFNTLNPDAFSQSLQIGQFYEFPLYH